MTARSIRIAAGLALLVSVVFTICPPAGAMLLMVLSESKGITK